MRMENLPSDPYPVTRVEYTEKVGSLGQKQIVDILREIYEKIKVTNVFQNGTDIQIGDKIGIEVWNWSKSHAYYSRAKSVIRNLADFMIKILICSFISKPMRAYIESFGIKVVELGFMVIPRKFLSFYIKRKWMRRKRVYSKRTLKLLRNILLSKIPLFHFRSSLSVPKSQHPSVYSAIGNLKHRAYVYLNCLCGLLNRILPNKSIVSTFEMDRRTWKRNVKTLERLGNNKLNNDSLDIKDILFSKNNFLLEGEKI